MNYAIALMVIFILCLVFLLKTVKRKGKSIIIFSYMLGLLIILSVIYVELIAKPMPYIAEAGEEKLAQQNEELIEAIQSGQVSTAQKEQSLLQSFEQEISDELTLMDSGNVETIFTIKESPTAKVASVNVYKLAIYFEGREYQYSNYAKYKIEDKETLISNYDDVFFEGVYVISSDAFFIPYANGYYEGSKNKKNHSWKNNGTQIIEVIVPKKTKVNTNEVVLMED